MWAVMALLVNPLAFAAHLCQSAPGTLPQAQQRSGMSVQACIHATAPMGDNACKAHCSHPADSNQQGKTPDIEPLVFIGQPVWNAVIDYGPGKRLREMPQLDMRKSEHYST